MNRESIVAGAETLKNNLGRGIPTKIGEIIPKKHQSLLDEMAEAAQEASLAAHVEMKNMAAVRDSRLLVIDDEPGDSKYLTVKDKYGETCFRTWDPDCPATDIGVRMLNPDYEGTANVTTIIHADRDAYEHFKTRGMPAPFLSAIGATAVLSRHLIEYASKPVLAEVARLYDVDPEAYVDRYYGPDEYGNPRRSRDITRVIMYHTGLDVQQRPVGEDGEPMLIKKHNDQGNWTIDVRQTMKGLQYYDLENGEWCDAGEEMAFFAGGSNNNEGYLGDTVEIPPAFHRVKYLENMEELADRALVQKGIVRVAIPHFIVPNGPGVQTARPNSAATLQPRLLQ